ncbi:hypothetical protein [Actinomadura sp. 3N508]|uniref:hypothetical protein n=1 Tax=Actinomadura sp. 3N508 TaxID=3375153 RepID=UPI00379E5B0A
MVTFDQHTEDGFAITDAIAVERGLSPAPPYDHSDVIAGQRGVAIRFLDRAGELDAPVVLMGGGMQPAGRAAVPASFSPDPRAIGVETKQVRSPGSSPSPLLRCRSSGRRQAHVQPNR